MKIYLNKPNLLAAGQKVEYTEEELAEYMKCAADPLYFIQNYCYIVHPDKGLIKFSLYPYQKRLVKLMHGVPEEQDLLKAPMVKKVDDDNVPILGADGQPIWKYAPKNVIVKTSRQVGKCVVGDTKIKVRNKTTGVVSDISIKDLFESADI